MRIRNGTKYVDVPNRAGYVYARVRNNLSEVVQVYNDAVVPAYGLQVLITRDSVVKSRYKVVAKDFGMYPDGWGTPSPYYALHASSHEFNPSSPGGDIVWVYPQQFLPLLAYPGSTGTVSIYPYTYNYNDTWYFVGNTGTASLITYNPTGTANNKVVLVYIDTNGNPQLTAGQEFASVTGSSQIVPYIPDMPVSGLYPLAAVRLAPTTTDIVWANLYDVRPFFDKPSTNTSSSSTPTYPSVYEDSTFKTTGTSFVFGSNMDVVVTGTTAFISSSVGSGRTLISEQTPTGTSTVTWNSILGTYKSLEIEYVARSDASSDEVDMVIRCNNDTTDANYRSELFFMLNVTSIVAGNVADITRIPANTASAGYAGYGIIKIINYASTIFHKMILCNSTERQGAPYETYFINGAVHWENTAAITRIDLVIDSGNYMIGSTFRLYGVN